MSFETFDEPSPSETVEKKEGKEANRGVALKALIAITGGVLSRNLQRQQESSFLIAAIEKAEETYRSLEGLERTIDPSGRLSGEIEDRLTNAVTSLREKISAHRHSE